MRNAAPIPGYENYYATPDGEIYHNERRLNPIPSNRGKSDRVKLKTEGKVVAVAVPKLVALAHVPNPDNLTNIILVDRDKSNYRSDNIRWVSLADSIRYNQRRIEMDTLLEESAVVTWDCTEISSAVAIPGYPDYKACSDGRIYHRNRLMNTRLGNGNRAARVDIRNEGGRKLCMTVAKLVAIAFLPNPEAYEHIVFKDRDKRNCRVENLRWVSKNEYGRFVHGCYDLDVLLSLPPRARKEPDWIDPERVPVKNHHGYFITRNGVFYHNDRIMSPAKRKGRSLKVRAKLDDGTYRHFGLATLVAEHFIPNPRRYRHVIFKDRNNHNCKMENIAWVDNQTYIYYCGIIEGMKKRVLTREEAIQKATDPYLRQYYRTLDEYWLTECWSNLEKRVTRHDWDECRSECYLYFMDRVKRFSLLKDPLGLMLVYAKGVRYRMRQSVGDYMPVRKVVQTDESLRNISSRMDY